MNAPLSAGMRDLIGGDNADSKVLKMAKESSQYRQLQRLVIVASMNGI
jgi:hypothetical protein